MNKPLAFLLLFALAAVTYMNTLPGEFVFDDQMAVVENPSIRNLSDWTKAARPFTELSYAIDFKLWGLNPAGYKATNIFLHAVNACLVYLILGMLFSDRLAQFAGAALFAVHPVFLQAVGYISGRSSVLCATFYFGAILAYLLYMKPTEVNRLYRACKWWQFFKSPLKTAVWWDWIFRGPWLALTFGLATCAWFSKQEAAALPMFLFALYALRGGRYVYPIAGAVLVALIAAYASIAPTLDSVAQNKDLTVAGFEQVLPFATYFPTYLTALTGYYYSKFLLPANLTVDPAYIQSSFASPSFLVALAILGLALLLFRKATFPVKFGILAILVSPLSVYAFVPMADPIQGHRAYIAGLGVVVLLAAFVDKLKSKRIPFAFLALIAGLAASTVAQNETWNSSLELWRHATVVNPNKGRAWLNLGYNQPNWRQAAKSYERAIQVQPNLWAAWVNIAALHLDHGNLNEGLRISRYVTEKTPTLAEGWIQLGVAQLRSGLIDEAIVSLEKAVQLKPESTGAQANLRIARLAKGQ